MGEVSGYERHQIESLLMSKGNRLQSGVGLFLAPDDPDFKHLYHAAVGPAMRENGLNQLVVSCVFDSDSSLNDICRHVQTAEVVVVDLSERRSDLLYVLGLCHGLGRCPLLIMRKGTELPFNLMALRCIEYGVDRPGLDDFREHLTRAIRVFLSAALATERESDS